MFLLHTQISKGTEIFEENYVEEFLGIIAGRSTYLKSNLNSDIPTYTRQYEPFINTDELRSKISHEGGEYMGKGYKKLGRKYSFTPISLYDGRNFTPLGKGTHSTMQGGGFFLVVKKFDKNDDRRGLNCFAYALGTYGEKLEKLSGLSMAEIQKSVKLSIDKAVKKWFDPIPYPKEPQEGDLVVYETTKALSTPSGTTIINPGTNTHAGIYRKSRPNWNSPWGGTVESKWGWFGNPYVF